MRGLAMDSSINQGAGKSDHALGVKLGDFGG
jgi:hypothetical protein